MPHGKPTPPRTRRSSRLRAYRCRRLGTARSARRAAPAAPMLRPPTRRYTRFADAAGSSRTTSAIRSTRSSRSLRGRLVRPPRVRVGVSAGRSRSARMPASDASASVRDGQTTHDEATSPVGGRLDSALVPLAEGAIRARAAPRLGAAKLAGERGRAGGAAGPPDRSRRRGARRARGAAANRACWTVCKRLGKEKTPPERGLRWSG
jgi:hypothetical protein